MASLMGGILGGKLLKNAVHGASDNGTLPLAGIAGAAAQSLVGPKKKKVPPLIAPAVPAILNSGTGIAPMTDTLS